MAERSISQTGIPDPIYDLISVAYHALQGAETYECYAQDAQKEGDQELAEFFRETQQQCQQTGVDAQQLLSTRLQQGERARPQVDLGAGQTGAAMGHAGSKPGQGS
jgi:rubrerythrin